MKKALIHKSDNRFMHAVGPMNPDRPTEPITAETIFSCAHGYRWERCGDEISAETHTFDGQDFVRKPPQPAPPA